MQGALTTVEKDNLGAILGADARARISTDNWATAVQSCIEGGNLCESILKWHSWCWWLRWFQRRHPNLAINARIRSE